MEKNELKCIKDIVFAGITYARKGEMIEVVYVGMQMGFNGSNGLFFSMAIDHATQYFNKSDIDKLYKSVIKD